MNTESSSSIPVLAEANDTNSTEAVSESSPRSSLHIPDDAMLIIPVRNFVMFPGLIMPIAIGRESTIRAVQEAMRGDRKIGVVLQTDTDAESPTLNDLNHIGTVASILRYVTAHDGVHHIICQGEQRFYLHELLDGYPCQIGRIELLPESEITSSEIEARVLQIRKIAAEVLSLMPGVPAELGTSIGSIKSAPALADFIAGLIDVKPEVKQQVLDCLDVQKRLDTVLEFMQHRLDVLRISEDIDKRTKQRFAEGQREALLREQMRTIQKQLGEGEGEKKELTELAEAITAANMPEEVEKQARKELQRLKNMPEAAGEYAMLRTYLDCLIGLPWSVTTTDRIDIAEARRILDEDHFGLDKIKRRILEYLAVRKLNPEGKSPILCFVGPPGVGKTSLGQTIAKAIGRRFVRVSLGGVHDEAEIRGHRRTYIGALPGNIIQAINKAGARNCVMMLDETDKLASSAHGDPSSALLEVLDPEQNSTFRDNYLALPFDLSKVMFICTANTLETIPGPLRDRMEIIQLSGYTEQEKVNIAKRYLIPRQLNANGLSSEQCQITEDAIHSVVNEYTREAGVRNLEREIGSVFRHTAMRIAEGTTDQVRIDSSDLSSILGSARFESESAMRTSVPGVATGLAWTPVGGDILFIEATRTPGNGKLILTGQLGDVMKESAQAALTLLKSQGHRLNVKADMFEHSDIHIHVPAGATPKDGPSAGVAMFVALASLMTDTAVHSDFAMTGEISLRGLVMPVGGIKEKVLAALRAGITTVMLPERNRKDLEDIPEDARSRLKFIWLKTVNDAIESAIGPG